ncbi:MAG TPA: HAMP domain-containing sensor histidine kinase [Ktedonobacterales bacterium]|nr:HAMP domain-containing sensor histidine kinase [Ktedonobacterales bacterium]
MLQLPLAYIVRTIDGRGIERQGPMERGLVRFQPPVNRQRKVGVSVRQESDSHHAHPTDGPGPPAQRAARTRAASGAARSERLAALGELASLLVARGAPLATLDRALAVAARMMPRVEQWCLYSTTGTAPATAHEVTVRLAAWRGEPAADPLARHAAPNGAHDTATPLPALAPHPTDQLQHSSASLGLGPAVDRRVLWQRRSVILGPRASQSASQRTLTRHPRAAHPTAHPPARASTNPTIGAAAALPLVSATGTLVGALVALAAPRHVWRHEELDLLDLLAHHLTILLPRCDLQPSAPAATAGPGANRPDERLEFISLAAHELRGPLATIKGYAQLLLRGARKDPTTSENVLRSLRAIDQQVTRMADLIGELLDVSRIQRGALELYTHPVELEPIVRHVVETRRATLDRHTLTVELATPPPIGIWDAARVEQIIRDLVDNAIRYSPQGGAIVVRVSGTEQLAQVCVSDQGMGVPPEERELIFDAFVRGAQPRLRHLSGLGLGLYVSQALARRMGGRLWLDTTSVAGAGSQFCVELPLRPD